MTSLGPYQLNTIVTGDARELAEAIPDNSVDLIFTDPEYAKVEDYQWLARTAARVLKPDSGCLVFAGIGYLREAQNALQDGGLNCRWLVPIYQPTISRRADAFFGLWYPLLITEKGRLKFKFTPQDLRRSLREQSLPANHSFRWTKDPDVIAYYIEACIDNGSTVVDFFCGGGTVPAVAKMLGVNYWACEIDPATADKARQRVLLTQPPLFVMPQPEQAELGL